MMNSGIKTTVMMILTYSGHSQPHTTPPSNNTSRKRSRDRKHQQNSKQDHLHCQQDKLHNMWVQIHHSGRGTRLPTGPGG